MTNITTTNFLEANINKMNCNFLPFQDIPYFSTRDKAYQKQSSELMPFLGFPFAYSEMKNVIQSRAQFPVDRAMFVNEIQRQYQGLTLSESLQKNIESLGEEQTYTVITAHQPSLFTGPFYFILKICSAIQLAKRLNADFPDVHVVPMFVLGAEDHDFDEINHTYIFGKKIEWNRTASGPVGRLDFTDFEESAVDVLFSILGESDNAQELKDIVRRSLEGSANYGDFMFKMVHFLFQEYGLVVASFDNKAFKNAFRPLIKKEIIHQFSKEYIVETQQRLSEHHYDSQAFAREINFFYFYEGKRLRIVLENERFHILETELSFSREEMIAEIDTHPDRFSPNVVMRPLFQELIMPNLAYIGGGGELAYWLERKSQFEAAGIFYPMLIRRNSAMYKASSHQKQLDKLDLKLEDLFQDTEQLIKAYAINHTEHEIDVKPVIELIEKAFSQFNQIATEVDGSLSGKVEAMKVNEINQIRKIETRLIRTIKGNQENTLQKIRKIKEELFPGNGLQERKTNFMEFYMKEGKALIPFLIENCDPFNKDFMVIEA